MKEHHFVRPSGPLGPFADDYRRHLVAAGYAFGSIQHRLTQFGELSRWLDAEGLQAIELDEAQVRRFAASRRAKDRVTMTSPATMRVPLGFLRATGTLAGRAAPDGPFEALLASYRRYLIDERGLAEKTVSAHLLVARRFCQAVAAGPADLAGLHGRDVTGYLLAECSRQPKPTARKTASSVASLLRYLHVAAVTPVSLVGAVPRLARREPGERPAEMTPAQVARTLECCDRRSGAGLRDYAILLLLARLGLRPCEVTALTLDDIDWRHGELVVRGKRNRHERLPLPADVGAAVASYLRQRRPAAIDGGRAVFLRARAPFTPVSFTAVQSLVRLASMRAGLAPAGPRRLRRHAATAMHRGGMALTGIAEVLRQHDTKVTTVYVDVDPTALCGLARVWPGVRHD
jgi:site-specific recombinase XerD